MFFFRKTEGHCDSKARLSLYASPLALSLRRFVFASGFFQVVFVITVVNSHLTMINFEDAVDEAAQEVAVMADEHDCAGKVL